MTVKIASSAGFCFGVTCAADALEKLLAGGQYAHILTLGELIHNPVYLASLEARGVRAVEEEEAARLAAESDVAGKTVLLFRTHGVSAATEERMRALTAVHPNFELRDLTCPFVKKIHTLIRENTRQDGLLFLFGKTGHPEVIGSADRGRGECRIVGSPEEVSALFDEKERDLPVVALSQTTESRENWKKIKKILENLYTNVIFFDTICSVTQNRQEETANLAAWADAVLVVGGKKSSNTRELYELAKEHCRDVRFLESADELTADFPANAKIAITAGASTPRGLIMEVYKKMDEIRTEDFAEMLEGTLKTLNTGETVTGIVSGIAKDAVYVDVGVKATGIVARDQITDDPDVNLSDLFKIGDELRLFVIRVSDTDGIVTLSKKRVDRDKTWYEVVALKEEGGIVEGKITEANKGGVVLDYKGTRIFIPASRTGLGKDEDFSSLVGTVQRARIIDVDETKKRAIGSIRSVKVEEDKAREEEIWSKLEVGQRYTGVVKNLTSYGAFVDIGGIDGMVHNTELSWKHIKSPKEVVAIGQELEVYIKELDPEKKRISLGYKAEENDPWRKFTDTYKVGDVVTGKVVSMMPFGAFVEVMDGVDGLVHISRIAQEKIARPQDVLTMGQEVTVKIVEIDNDRRRLSLSIRALLDEAQRAAEQAEREAERAERAAERDAARREEEEARAEMAPYIVRSID